MNTITTLCVPVLLVVCLWASRATAIRCYSCLPLCDDDYKIKNNTCEGKVCYKMRGKVDGVEKALRYCGNENVQDMGCKNGTLFGIKGSLCSCDSDLCNGAETMRATGASVVLATFILAKNLM